MTIAISLDVSDVSWIRGGKVPSVETAPVWLALP